MLHHRKTFPRIGDYVEGRACGGSAGGTPPPPPISRCSLKYKLSKKKQITQTEKKTKNHTPAPRGKLNQRKRAKQATYIFVSTHTKQTCAGGGVPPRYQGTPCDVVAPVGGSRVGGRQTGLGAGAPDSGVYGKRPSNLFPFFGAPRDPPKMVV